MYYSDELYHHGIKGQRWGRRNGPPYPLSPQTHASVVRSAGRGGYTGSKSTKRRGRIGGLTEEDTKYDPKFRTKAERDEYERRSARAQKIKKGLMIGAGAAALAGAAAYGLARRGGYGTATSAKGLKAMGLYAKRGARMVGNDISRFGKNSMTRARNAGENIYNKAARSAASTKRGLENAQLRAEVGYNNARSAVRKAISPKYNDYAGAAKNLGNEAYRRTGTAVNAVRRSLGVGRRAVRRGSTYITDSLADRYGYNAVNMTKLGLKSAAKGAAIGAGAGYVYKKAKKKRSSRR